MKKEIILLSLCLLLLCIPVNGYNTTGLGAPSYLTWSWSPYGNSCTSPGECSPDLQPQVGGTLTFTGTAAPGWMEHYYYCYSPKGLSTSYEPCMSDNTSVWIHALPLEQSSITFVSGGEGNATPWRQKLHLRRELYYSADGIDFFVNQTPKPPTYITINFSATEDGDITKKLKDVDISLNTGQYGITDINGNLTFWNQTPTSGVSYTAIKTGYLAKRNYTTGSIGTTGGTISFTMINTANITVSNMSLYLDIRDAVTGNYIAGASEGIQNKTSGVWRNGTTSTGSVWFDSTGANMEYPLTAGTTVKVAASATGYQSADQDVLVLTDKQLTTLYLTPTTAIPTNGNWNLLVTVKRNLDAQPVNSASVQLITGVNGPGEYLAVTDSTGTASFMNISASSSASINVIAQGYQSASAYTPVVPNSTQRITIQLIRIGQTAVATPIPTTAPSNQVTGQPTVSVTDADGNPITTSEGKATWGLEQIFNIIPQMAIIVAALIIAWLFWRGMDIVSNGMCSLVMRKVIEGFLKGMFK